MNPIFMSFPCIIRIGLLSKNTNETLGKNQFKRKQGLEKPFVSVETEEKEDRMAVLRGSH